MISEETYKLVTQMLERVNEIFKIDFRYDLELITMLSTHLMPLEIRAKHGIAVHNSLADDIRHNVILSYNMAIIACDTLEQKIRSKTYQWIEIAFVALPFSLALKRKWKKSKSSSSVCLNILIQEFLISSSDHCWWYVISFTLITGKIDNGAIVPSNQSFQNIYDIGQAGFLGSLILGFVVGYFVKWTKSWKVPDGLKPMMPTFFIPVITTLILGLFYTYVLTYPLNAFVQAIVSIMNQLNGTSTVIVGIVLILAFTKPILKRFRNKFY